MKAISLWQPWASLVALSLKLIETRGRLTHIRGRIAIHAAAKKYSGAALAALLAEAGVDSALVARDLPLGAIVAVATLEDCVSVDERHTRLISMPFREMVFGNYSAGRFAWMLKDVVPVVPAIPCKGRQGWFNLPKPIYAQVTVI